MNPITEEPLAAIPASPRLSVVVPCFNEARRIGATLDRLEAYFGLQSYATELVVVDDGSADNTAALIREGHAGVRLIRYETNRGKGYAVKLGMLEACGDFRLVYDADGSTPVEEVEKLWPVFDAGADAVIGSRTAPGASIEARQPRYREVIGKLGNVFMRLAGLTEFTDTQCGFKAFTADAARIIFPRQVMERFGADCEYLCIARVHGLKVAEIPVRWINCPDTRVHPARDTLRTLAEVLVVRANLWRRRYD